MMGSGKSTVGKMLAERMDYEFTDTDTRIENQEQRSISEIFENSGENYFRQLEKDLISNLLTENIVVATGGGLPCFYDNMQSLLTRGLVFYMAVKPETIVDRISSLNDRPLLYGMERQALLTYLTDLLESRKKYYERAHFTVDAEPSPQEVTESILRYLHEVRYLHRIR
jgi:shikimate kinase